MSAAEYNLKGRATENRVWREENTWFTSQMTAIIRVGPGRSLELLPDLPLWVTGSQGLGPSSTERVGLEAEELGLKPDAIWDVSIAGSNFATAQALKLPTF